MTEPDSACAALEVKISCRVISSGGAIVGAGNIVTKDVPPYMIGTSFPARVLRT